MLAQINWGLTGCLYYIPLELQIEIFNTLGRNNYLKLPKTGTNPRGVEFSREALLKLENHNNTSKIVIDWVKPTTKLQPFEAYRRWVEYWNEE